SPSRPNPSPPKLQTLPPVVQFAAPARESGVRVSHPRSRFSRRSCKIWRMETAAPKEAPPPQPQPGVEEDGTLSATAAMARDAAVLFQSRRYAECADVLAQLLLKKEGDPKVGDWISAFASLYV
uniref:CCR4-NOT transcription complex subunit 10 n=2 Tax=Aegilops tauschii subsp. strangulata TaxID=200361 RepID=A0A453KGZ6_AEGTS